MSQSRKKYDKDFKEQAVKIVLDPSLSKAEVARRLGVHQSMIDNWVRAYQEGAIVAFPDNGNLKPQDEELRRLREGVKRQRMERELFKKTAKRIRQYIFSLSLSQFHDITETGPDWPSFGDVMKNPG